MTGWEKIKKSAEYAGIGERTLRRWLKDGLVYSRLPSGTVLIHRDDIDRFIKGFRVSENQVDKIANEVLGGL